MEEERKAEAKKRWDLDAKKNIKAIKDGDVRNIQNKETDLANYKISIGQNVLSDATGQ